jgi:outer membrane protein TolC
MLDRSTFPGSLGFAILACASFLGAAAAAAQTPPAAARPVPPGPSQPAASAPAQPAIAQGPQTVQGPQAIQASPMERLNFAEAIRRALARNPSIEVAREEIARAEALVRQSQAQWFPVLTGNGTYTRLDNHRGPPGLIFINKQQEAANLNLSVPLFAPSRWLATSRAGEFVDVQKASADDVRRTIALAAGRAYLAVVASRRFSDASLRARDNARDHFDFSHTRRVAGVGNRIDEVRSAQELATAESQLNANLAALARSQEALGVLLGGDAPIDAVDRADLPVAIPTQLDLALKDARDRRGDLEAQRARLSTAQHAVRDSWADYAPLLTAAFQPFYQNPASITQPETGWQAQLVLTLPLYDGGLRYGLRRERKAFEAEAKVGLDASLRQAASEVRAAFEALRLADLSLGSARSAAQLAIEALQLADLSYRAGAVNNLEVVDAQRRARDADSAAAAAEDASRQARLDLLAASGHFP